MKGYINSIESFATLDGSGIRYEIFLQGCPLRCNFCHNPETWQKEKANKIISANEFFKQILRYKNYFGKTGGVTFSGGEPLLQAKFLIELCKKLKKENINIALDTCGNIFSPDTKNLTDLCDLVILDLKYDTEDTYKKYTSGSLNTTLKYLGYLNEIGKNTWIRTVIVPGLNDTTQFLDACIGIIQPFTCISRYELLGFHTMGFAKYDELRIHNPLGNTPALDSNRLAELQQYVNSHYKSAHS